MSKVRWKVNVDGLADLRNHPTLVGAMRSAADGAIVGTGFEVDVVTWPHGGRRSGPRTSVQIWANTPRARVIVNRDPDTLVRVLNKARI